MAVALGHCVVDRVMPGSIRCLEVASPLEINLDIQGFASCVENDVSHVPGGRNAKGSLKDMSAHHSSFRRRTGDRIPTNLSTEL